MELHEPFTVMYEHNLWANLRLLEACAQLSDEQLDNDLDGTYGTIRATLEHIAKAERNYLARISTGQLYDGPKGSSPMTLAEIAESLRASGEGLVEWATRIRAEDLVTIDWDGTPRDVPKSIILTQAIDHTTDHRSQIKTIMTQLGVEPPDLQSWAYFDEMDG